MAYRYVKRMEQGPPPVGIDILGVTEVRPQKMAKAIRAFWNTVLGELDTVSWDAVYERWQAVLAPLGREEVSVPAVTGRDLQAAVAGMWSGVSEGPDGLTRVTSVSGRLAKKM